MTPEHSTDYLKDFPEKERSLWRAFETIPFERGISVENISGAEVQVKFMSGIF
jgi:hypothetical protein